MGRQKTPVLGHVITFEEELERFAGWANSSEGQLCHLKEWQT